MIKVCRERCIIINYKERDNGSMFIVFMLPGNGLFLKGSLTSELMANVGDLRRFYWADIEFTDDEDEDATLEILKLQMEKPVEQSPPAF